MSTSAPPAPADPSTATGAPPADAGAGSRPPVSAAWKNAAGYAAVVLATLAATAAALQLWRADLRVPLEYSGDNLLNQALCQSILESGWFQDVDRLGAPGRLDMRDFPIPDILHCGVIKLLGCVFRDAAVMLNLYALLPFPLTALSAYFVLRRFKLGRLTALVPAVLYACTYYHFWRMKSHVFLAAYYLLPLMILLLVRVSLGRYPFLRDDPGGGKPHWRFLSWRSAGAVMLCVLTGLAGVYYAFFSCFFLCAVAVKAAFRDRKWAPIWVSAILILIIGASVGAALSPSLLHLALHGKNPEAAVRAPGEADLYGLSIGELLLPIPGHRLAYFVRLRARFLAPPRTPTGEGYFVSLGVVGALGFLWLVGRFLWRRRDKVDRVEDSLAYLNVAAVFLGTVGGFGACFNFLVTPMIRCYNRISIFIAFFALCGLFLVVQRLANRYVKGRRALAIYAVGLGAVLLLGVLDQTSAQIIPHYKATKAEYDSDADFGRRMEAVLPPGAMVYQMPHVDFPEAPNVHELLDYQLVRPYLHTHTLRWSYGAMRGRDACRWLADVADHPLADALPMLAFAGFSGVYLDRAGYADHGAAVEAELQKLLGVEPLVSLTERQTFFDMTAYVAGIRARCTDAEWQAKRDAVLHSVQWRWGGSFSGPEEADEGTARWCGANGVLQANNPWDRPQHVVLKMECSVWQEGPNRLVLDGDLCHREMSLTATRQPLELDLIVAPGEHVIHFSCDGPAMPRPADPRQLVHRVWNFVSRVEE